MGLEAHEAHIGAIVRRHSQLLEAVLIAATKSLIDSAKLLVNDYTFVLPWHSIIHRKKERQRKFRICPSIKKIPLLLRWQPYYWR